MDGLLTDLRSAVRRLLTHRKSTAVIVLILALGIGANSAVFSVVNSVVFSPLPYGEPDRLVMVWEHNLPRNRPTNVVNPVNYLDWKERARSFTDLAAIAGSAVTFVDGDAPQRVSGRAVTANYFSVLASTPAIGRTFSADEALPDRPEVLVLSYGLWISRFGGDSSVVNRSVRLGDGTARILGVMPASFAPMSSEQYWEPLRLDPGNRERRGRYAMVVGRLAPGVTKDAAHAEMVGISRQLAESYPNFNAGWSANVVSLQAQLLGASDRILPLLLGAAVLVLLIACANVGNLILARTAARARELSVRATLGAPQWRLARQLLAENLMLAVTGGAAGLLLAAWAVAALVAAAPRGIPRLGEIALDLNVFLAAAAASLVVGALITLPAIAGAVLQAGARGPNADSTRTTVDARGTRYRRTLVVAQLALAVMLLAGAGLLIRSVDRLTAVDAGFDPSNVVTMSISLPADPYSDDRDDAFYDALLMRTRALGGIAHVGAVDALPLQIGSATRFSVVGMTPPAPGQEPVADIRIVDSGYFAVMRIAHREGRVFGGADRADTPPVVLVNETMARQMWPGESSLDKRLRVNMWEPEAEPVVIGVVADVKTAALEGAARPTVYYPRAQVPDPRALTLVVRAERPVASVAPELRAIVRDLDRTLPAGAVIAMNTWVNRSISDRRYTMFLLTAFAALAALLAALGIYAVESFSVNQRTREIGVRVALGARPAAVLQLVLREGAALLVVGLGLGLIGAFFATGLLRDLLFGVGPRDPVTIIATAGALALVAVIATLLPARRAARVDPMIALRSE